MLQNVCRPHFGSLFFYQQTQQLYSDASKFSALQQMMSLVGYFFLSAVHGLDS